MCPYTKPPGTVAESMEERARAGVLLLCAEARAAITRAAEERLASAGFVVLAPELSTGALCADRRALQEIDAALEMLVHNPDVDRERLGVLGFGRGGTLAFLLACTRRLAAVVDVDGPVLYPALSAERPIQPLELALNLEGSFLGVFSGPSGPVGDEEIELLRERLSSAARPFDIVVGPRTLDEELWPRVLAFLRQTLAEAPD